MSNAFVGIRRLGAADTALLRALNQVFAEAFNDAESYREAPPSDAYLTGLLAKEHVIALGPVNTIKHICYAR